MKKAKKSRGGRPATGKTPILMARFPKELTQIDDYAKRQSISRSKALRALCVIALERVRGK